MLEETHPEAHDWVLKGRGRSIPLPTNRTSQTPAATGHQPWNEARHARNRGGEVPSGALNSAESSHKSPFAPFGSREFFCLFDLLFKDEENRK